MRADESRWAPLLLLQAFCGPAHGVRVRQPAGGPFRGVCCGWHDDLNLKGPEFGTNTECLSTKHNDGPRQCEYGVMVFGEGMVGVSDDFRAADMEEGVTYRIPSIMRTKRGTLLAFAERRVGSAFDNATSSLVLRRSMDDGYTWGPITTVAEATTEQPNLSNPNPVEVTMPDGRSLILLHYDTMNNPTPSLHGDNMQVWSRDEGVVWENRENISHFMPWSHAGCMPGPSQGIQTEDGAIYFSCHLWGGWQMLYGSDDYGASWRPRLHLPPQMDECAIAPLPRSRIAMSCRTNNLTMGRAHFTMGQGGQTFESLSKATLLDPGCQGSVVNLNNTLFVSHVDRNDARVTLTVSRSTDEGATWDSKELLWIGFSGYSQLVGWSSQGDGGVLGVLYETGNKRNYEGIFFTSWVV